MWWYPYRMFPTHVGMNRRSAARVVREFNVPHTRGDEPLSVLGGRHDAIHVPHTRGDEPFDVYGEGRSTPCSPHTWG